jgi:hypothetical protein
LALLRQSLVYNKGIESEGIFRLSGNETEIKELKLALNMDQFDPNKKVDVYTTSSLLKVLIFSTIILFIRIYDFSVGMANCPKRFSLSSRLKILL